MSFDESRRSGDNDDDDEDDDEASPADEDAEAPRTPRDERRGRGAGGAVRIPERADIARRTRERSLRGVEDGSRRARHVVAVCFSRRALDDELEAQQGELPLSIMDLRASTCREMWYREM
jgi:hypothetical protein